MVYLTKPQRAAVKRIYTRHIATRRGERSPPSYRQFRKTVQLSFDCAMVEVPGMWLGVELDGYTHS